MRNFLKDNTIENRVMGAVRSKIKSAQVEFDSGVGVIEKMHEEAIRQADAERETRKAELADKLVGDIIGKFI